VTRRLAAALAGTLLLLGAAATAGAHEVRPGYLEMRERDAGTWDVLWKVPGRGDQKPALRPRFPPGCRPREEPVSYRAGDAWLERCTLSCPGGLEGRTLAVDGLEATMTDVLVRLVRADGRVQAARLTAGSPSLVVEAVPDRLRAAAGYFRIGLEHILLGVDHLLFVLGLLLLVRDRRTLVWTITAFTAAHSLTLAAATLGWARAPAAPLNAAIALSILFLGPEVLRARAGKTSLTIRNPWVVSFAFGLLHGFGFASGLAALGLPPGEVPLALLLFNVGVEAGQLLFVALVLLLAASFRVLEVRWAGWARSLPAYAVGSLGAFWTIQRTAVLLGGGR
jgi:hydrogenase/urease accessory protein HupE